MADQKVQRYSLGPFYEPVLRIGSGETVLVETEDAFSGQVRSPQDRRDTRAMPFSNPVMGPIHVEGAEKGDTLAVKIRDIRPRIGQGATRIPSWWWYLCDQSKYAYQNFLGVSLPHGTRICPIRDGKVIFDHKHSLPYAPMIGTIGTAPEIESISSEKPGPHGGNMDVPDVACGNTLYLPVNVSGACLYIGDVHATQGDAELCGTAIEMPAEIEATVEVIRKKQIGWPRIDAPEFIAAIACSGTGMPLDEAVRIAFVELIHWLENDYSFDRWDAYQLCTQIAKANLGNIWTIVAKFPKKYL
ncbi:MAG TPA: acetamidase/formamidase family protein [Candidatus Acidoferrum sp.]|nr:acetamidase/formamidase family protein [Candidatus Acidoferrum sp.]